MRETFQSNPSPIISTLPFHHPCASHAAGGFADTMFSGISHPHSSAGPWHYPHASVNVICIIFTHKETLPLIYWEVRHTDIRKQPYVRHIMGNKIQTNIVVFILIFEFSRKGLANSSGPYEETSLAVAPLVGSGCQLSSGDCPSGFLTWLVTNCLLLPKGVQYGQSMCSVCTWGVLLVLMISKFWIPCNLSEPRAEQWWGSCTSE